MKKNLIILSLIACLFSCGNVTGNGGTEIDDSDKGQFYSSELVDFSKYGLSKFYVSDGAEKFRQFANTILPCNKLEVEDVAVKCFD